MDLKPEITNTKSLDAAVIHLVIPRDRIQSEMPQAIQEILAAPKSQGVQPVGPLFAHHLTTSNTQFDFEVGFPVNSAISPAGRVKAGELPGARVAKSVCEGGYEGLFAAWSAFDQWVTSGKLVGRGDLWEVYVTGPESSPDPSTWRTELYRPLI